MKVVIKNEKPELKMADILKVVAERWKNLLDDQRVIFQRKAQAEKELTKAKMSEYMSHQVEEPPKSKKDVLHKKHVQSQKRVQKALLKATVKVEASSPLTETKIEASENNTYAFEEPAVFKQQVVNVCFNPLNNGAAATTIHHIPMNTTNHLPMNNNFFNYQFHHTTQPININNFPNPLYAQNFQAPPMTNMNVMNNYTIPQMSSVPSLNNNISNQRKSSITDSDLCLPDLSFFKPANFSKTPSQDPFFPKYVSDELEFNKDPSQFWNYYAFDSHKPEKDMSACDLLNFYSTVQEQPKLEFVKREDDYLSSEDDDDYLTSTASNLSPLSDPSLSSRSKNMNNYLLSALESNEQTEFGIFDRLTLDENPERFALYTR